MFCILLNMGKLFIRGMGIKIKEARTHNNGICKSMADNPHLYGSNSYHLLFQARHCTFGN